MIESITKAFNSYSKKPFLFVWSSLMYIILLLAFFFAAVGVLLAYFMVLSMFDRALELDSLPTMAIFGVIGLVFVFFTNGLNAALAKAYRSAVWDEKTSLTKFYTYVLEKSVEMFGIMLVRDLFWLLLAGPAIGLYLYMLDGVQYMDLLLWMYVLSVTFVVHMLFTPAFIAAGAFNMGTYAAMKHAFEFMRRKHIFFIGMYVMFAIVWALNFIPFVQFVTIFFAYPLLYAAMAVMMEDSLKLKEGEEE
ncbi:MAG: hypothetical protein AB1295_00950 [Candidatus Micrarchaeota archaeon]